MSVFSSEKSTKPWDTMARDRRLGPVATLISGLNFTNAGGGLPAVATARRLAAMLWQRELSGQPGPKVSSKFGSKEKMRVFSSMLESDVAKSESLSDKSIRKDRQTRGSPKNACRKSKIKELSTMIREAENDKEIMRLTEVWYEEHARMKLVDAASIMEDKYREINDIIADIEAFLRSTNVKDHS